jgi:hypothetical protein
MESTEKEARLIFHDVEASPELPSAILEKSPAEPADHPIAIEWTNPPLPPVEKPREDERGTIRKMLDALKAMIRGTNMQGEGNS